MTHCTETKIIVAATLTTRHTAVKLKSVVAGPKLADAWSTQII